MAVASSPIHGCENEKPTAFFLLNSPSIKDLISFEDVKVLEELDIASARSKLAEILDLDDYETDMKSAILTDYYFSGYWWARSNLIQPEKIVPFMGLLKTLLKNMTHLRLNEEENLKFLKKTMISSSETSSENILCFSMKDAQDITEFLMTGLFQHYKLYECCFRRKRPKALITEELKLETIEPVVLQSLDEAMDEESVLLAQEESELRHSPVYVGSHRNLNLRKTFLFSEIHGA